MKKKVKGIGILLLQSASIWMLGWGCCLGISRLMVLLNLGG